MRKEGLDIALTAPVQRLTAAHGNRCTRAAAAGAAYRHRARPGAVRGINRACQADLSPADPGLLERASTWFWDRIGQLLSHTNVLGGLPLIGLLVIVGVLALVVGLLIWRYGVPAGNASARTGDLFNAGQALTSGEHGALAADAARQGRWSVAVQERFRALVRGLEERDLIPSGDGRTAMEAMASARAALPALGGAFTGAAVSFDDVTYGGRDGEEATYQRLTDLEATVRTTRATAAPERAHPAFALPR